MARLGRWLTVALWVLPIPAVAQTAAPSVTITGTTLQVTTNTAPQYGPRISGNVVVYTDLRNGNEDVYDTDLTTMKETQVTTSTADQALFDISGQRIVYTDYSATDPAVEVYDISTAATQPLVSTAGSQVNPGISGTLVAYEYTPDGSGQHDIWATDVSTGQTFAVTNDADLESNPAVSGQYIVFERRLVGRTDNDVILYDVSTGTETVVAGTTSDEENPAIDGTTVVYDAVAAGRTDRDVYIYDIPTGTTTEVDLPGNQIRPRISGNVVAFDDDSQGTYNVMLYYVPTGYTYAVTTDSSTDYLNDIDGTNLVYTSDRSGNPDIWLFQFTVNVPQTGGTAGGGTCSDPAKNACTDDSALDPVFSGTYTRDHGKPRHVTDTFGATAGEGVAVIRSDCASATAILDGRPLLSSCDLHPGDGDHEGQGNDDGGGDGCLARKVTLHAHNTLDVEVASKPGCQVAIDVYAVPKRECDGGHDGDHGDHDHGDHGDDDGAHDHGTAGGSGSTGGSGGSGGYLGRLGPLAPGFHGLGGCASGPGAAGWFALALVLLALGVRRRHAPRPAPVRTRRR